MKVGSTGRSQPLAAWPKLEEEDPSVADSLGRAYAHTSQHEAAIALFERRLQAAEAKQDVLGTVRFGVLLANTLVDCARFGRAEEVLGHALALAHDLGDPIVRARLWWSQSRLHALQKNPPLAERYARMALDTLLLTEHVRYTALAHQVLAHIKLDKGEPEEALELLDQGLPLIRQGGNAYEEAEFALERARALLTLGRTREAAELAEACAEQMLEPSPIDAGRALALLAERTPPAGRRRAGDRGLRTGGRAIAGERPLPARGALQAGRAAARTRASGGGARRAHAGGRAHDAQRSHS